MSDPYLYHGVILMSTRLFEGQNSICGTEAIGVASESSVKGILVIKYQTEETLEAGGISVKQETKEMHYHL